MIILITDDDRLVRFTIKSMLGDILGDSGDIFLEAKDGAQMVQICREKQPDIVFVDIKMPNMNGLDAIEQCKKFTKHTEYVVVSGYSDFEYAKRGIRLGVTEYLLKPVDEEEISAVMKKLSEKLKRHKIDSNSRFQLCVMEAFNYYATLGTTGQNRTESIREGYELLTFMLWTGVGRDDCGHTVRAQQKLLDETAALGNEVIGRKGYYAVAVNGYGTLCLVFETKEAEIPYILSQIRRISQNVVKEQQGMHYLLWFREASFLGVCTRSEALERTLPLLMQKKPGSVCSEEELMQGEKEKEVLYLIDKLVSSWTQADGVACKDIMNQIWRQYRNEALELNFRNISTYCRKVTGCDIAGEDIRGFCSAFVNSADQIYDTVNRIDGDVIEQTKEYIQKYYMNDISISKIAEQFKLTANYLSTIFHERTGRRFVDYLSATRVEAAKKLLIQNASASVQDIALMVGYSSARHFSSLFQKQTGMTPSVYRKEHV